MTIIIFRNLMYGHNSSTIDFNFSGNLADMKSTTTSYQETAFYSYSKSTSFNTTKSGQQQPNLAVHDEHKDEQETCSCCKEAS